MILRAIKELLSPKEIDKEKIECAVDGETVPCDTLEDVFFSPEAQGSWIGIPAPTYLEDDPWFGPAPTLTEKQEEFKAESEAFKAEALKYYEEQTNEPENIHEVMYQMSMSSGETTIQRDPIGGSETFQEGPGGWQSGVGR